MRKSDLWPRLDRSLALAPVEAGPAKVTRQTFLRRGEQCGWRRHR
jgi:hypothetical protein